MTYAQQAGRANTHTAFYVLTAGVAAILVALVVGISTIGFPNIGTPALDNYRHDEAVLEAGRQWELQRKQQAGIDPVVQAGRDWEKQRKQQSGE